jgi:hypothetical protein
MRLSLIALLLGIFHFILNVSNIDFCQKKIKGWRGRNLAYLSPISKHPCELSAYFVDLAHTGNH